MSNLSKKLDRAKHVLKLNFGTLDIELMVDYLTSFQVTMAGERQLRRFNAYLLQEGLNQREANAIIVKSLNLEQGVGAISRVFN